MQQYSYLFFVWLRGVAMGAADAVPGVSGGTVAFITGIYEQLIESIRRISPAALRILFKQGPLACWQHINGTFLLVLLTGIVCSLLTIARVVLYLLEYHPVLVWAFFFGLILSSAIWMLNQVSRWGSAEYVALIIGTAVALFVTSVTPVQAQITPLTVFLAGSVAICAMILPGISGSFILLLMGMYTPIMGAIKGLELDILGYFVLGCGLGLLSFSHVLGWMFRRYHNATVALLTGFMIGSLNKVWPWKYTTSYRINSKGEQVPLIQDNVMPVNFQALTGSDAQLLAALALMLAAGLMVYLLEWKMNRSAKLNQRRG